MSYTSFQKRIDRIVSDMAIRNRYTSVCMSKQEHPEYKNAISDALVSICEVPEESAFLFAEKITSITCESKPMNTTDILSFFKKEYGI